MSKKITIIALIVVGIAASIGSAVAQPPPPEWIYQQCMASGMYTEEYCRMIAGL